MTTAIGTSPPRTPRREPAAFVIAALHRRAEAIRREELSRLEGRWDTLCSDDRRRLEALTRRIVDAILHEPTARLQAGTARDGADLESARYLFGLKTGHDTATADRRPARP